jgi:RNA polymerase sigma-70 factor (ECF subfamily)
MDGEEARFLESARAGSAESFSALVRLHHAPVRAYVGRFLSGREVVDDVAQETFLRAWLTLSGYRGESSFRMWLLGIARHRALMALRDEQRRRPQGFLAELMARRLEADPAETHERRLAALRNCLQALPAAGAGLVEAFYFQGRPAAEIAREGGKKEGAVWMALLRVRQALRECMELKLGARGAES